MEIYLIARNNLKRSLKYKSRILIAFLLPIVLCLIAGYLNTNTSVKIRIGVMENTAALEQLQKIAGVEAELAEKPTYHTDLIMGKYQAVVTADNKVISLMSEARQAYCQELIQGIITGKTPMAVMKQTSKNMVLSATERSMAFLMTLFLVMATLHGAMLIKDKKTGTFTRCLYAISGGKSYIFGNIMFNFCMTFIQVAIAFLMLMLIQQDRSIRFGQGMIMVLLISTVTTVYATCICMISNSDVQANITSGALASIFSIIGGTFVAVDNMPLILQYASILSPIRWVIELSRMF